MESPSRNSLDTLFSKTSGSAYHFLSKEELQFMSLIQNQIQPYFPQFAAALGEQPALDREQGRCAVVDFTDPQGHQISTFNSATELTSYLSDTAPSPCAPQGRLPRRRLFILEDLPCNHILALGSRLRIPPNFFAGHWDEPALSTFGHRNPFQRCALPHFRLRYATSNRVEVDLPTSCNSAEKIFAFDSKVRRYLHTYGRNGLIYDEAKSHHCVSFWSSLVKEDGSWDAVLLVDPPVSKYVRCVASGRLLPLRTRLADETSMPKKFLNPEMESHAELPADCAQWGKEYSAPQYKSMFDDTLAELSSGLRQVTATHDPLSVVEIPRKLVISTLIAYIRRRYVNLVSIQKSEGRPYAMRQNYLAGFSKSNYSSWSGELFDFIIAARAAIQVFAREMDDNVVALGLDTPDCSAPQWERYGWRSIVELTRVVEDTVNAFATSYLQYVTIQEAHVSNANAHSLSKITVLSMLFIPISTVASIFSMGGDFLPGESRAWVFWAVTIPLIAVLACLYWYRMIVRLWQSKKQELLPIFERRSAKTR